MDLTSEQLAIKARARQPGNFMITALAGAAKTTTLVLLAQAMRPEPTLSLAFNKAIATEMSKRMPGFVECATLNSVGHRAWGARLGKRLIVDSDKMYGILARIRESGSFRQEEKNYIGENTGSFLKAAGFAKTSGYVPSEFTKLARSLYDLDEFLEMIAAQIDCEPDDFFANVLERMLSDSISQAFGADIDFDDQIYMPTMFGAPWQQFPQILIDEAQDLSRLNHIMLEKLLSAGGRIIAVGDPRQAIYGFRGADHRSMSRLQKAFGMEELNLSTTFRCSISVVERARAFVPQMMYPSWAKAGTVAILDTWNKDTIPDGAVIICRNNSPLFSMAMKLIRRGRGVKLRKSDIGKSLVKLMQKIGKPRMAQAEYLVALETWLASEKSKSRESRHHSLEEKYECMKVFALEGQDREAAIAYAEHLFNQSGPIELTTGHGAKGAEWDVVFHLDPWLIPSRQAQRLADAGDDRALQQERNLRYVIETRAKDSLFIANTEDFR